MNWFQKLQDTFLEDNRYMWLVEGLGNTLLITLGALIIGVIIGTLIAVTKYFCEGNKKLRFFNWLCDLYTTVIRGIPVTVLLLVFFYIIFVSVKDGVPVAIIAFGINSGAYMAELIRSGINAVDKGQMEAARSLGLSKGQAMAKIIFPQAIKNILPAIGNECIALLKETSVAGYVAVVDVTKAATNIRNKTYDAVNPIILLGLIIFFMFRWIRGSSAMSIFVAIVSLYLIRIVVDAFNMRLMTAIMDMVLDVGMIALIIIFQPEIRKFLIKLGNRYMNNAQGRAIMDRILGKKAGNIIGSEAVNDLTEACRRMSEDKTGALIVIAHKSPLDDIISTGDRIDAGIHRRLIMNLFFKNSPLHDGAMVIVGNRIVAARCTLPITERTNIPANYGMRHKAAIGITEETDANVIVVSEETGNISFVKEGQVTPIQNINELKLLLSQVME